MTTHYTGVGVVVVSMCALVLIVVLGCVYLYSLLVTWYGTDKKTFSTVYSLTISETLFGVVATFLTGVIVVVGIGTIGFIGIFSTGATEPNVLSSPFIIVLLFLCAYTVALAIHLVGVPLLHWSWKKVSTVCSFVPEPQPTSVLVTGCIVGVGVLYTWSLSSDAPFDWLASFLFLSGYLVGTLAAIAYASIVAS